MTNDQTTVYFADVDWKDDDSVKAFVQTIIETRERFNFERQRQAEINVAWYRGHQETRWAKTQKRMLRVPNPNGRVRLIINMIQPFVDGYVSKLSGEEIEWEVMPATGDGSDFDTAKLSTQILKSYSYDLGLDGLASEADYWAVLTGEAFVKVCWNPEAGDPLDLGPDDVNMEPDEFSKEYGVALDSMKTGDLSVEVIPLFSIVWGPDAAKFEDAEYVLEIHEKSAAYCMAQYGLTKEEAINSYGDNTLFRPGGSGAFGAEAYTNDDELCLVSTLWVKKNRAIKGLEQGRCTVIVGDKVVKNDSNPYKHGQIPIVSWPFKRPPGQIAGETFVDQLIAPQADLNINVSQQCENRELMGNPVWLAQTGSISNINDWVARPGGIREYKGTVPQLEAGQAMPAAVLVQFDKIVRAMQDIVGLHDVSQAKVPSGGRSGRAIAMLKDADNERFGPIARQRQKLWSRVGHLALQTIAQFATEQRIVRALGDENEWNTIVFEGKDVVGGVGPRVSYFDVRVRSNGQPGSQAIRQEAMGNLVQMGFFDPLNKDDKTKVLEVMQLGSTREPLDAQASDRDRQRRENAAMARGEPAPVSFYEDHRTHIDEMDKYRKRPKYRELSPQIQAIFDKHEADHVGAEALRQFRHQAWVQQALVMAGVVPAPMQALPPGAPPMQNNSQPPLDSNLAPQI